MTRRRMGTPQCTLMDFFAPRADPEIEVPGKVQQLVGATITNAETKCQCSVFIK